MIDGWNVSIIVHYARVIWKRKGRENLEDPNDLLPQPAPTRQELTTKKEVEPQMNQRISNQIEESQSITEHRQLQEQDKDNSSNFKAQQDHNNQLHHQKEISNPNRSSFEDVWKDDQELVLNDLESNRLRGAQEKLCRSQTWYRPHSSATHYAFPIRWAVLILLLNLGNSIFQLGLCVVMWGLTYSTRPAWTTATFMALSFSCGITSAVLIWRIGVKTSKSKKVLKEVTEALKPTTQEKFINRVNQQHRRNPSKSFQVINRIKQEILKPNSKKERSLNDGNDLGSSIQGGKSTTSIIPMKSKITNHSCTSGDQVDPIDSSHHEHNTNLSDHLDEPCNSLLNPLSNLSSSDHVLHNSHGDDPHHHSHDHIQIIHD